MNDIIFEKDKIYIKNATNFDLDQTLDCGQAFRWSQNSDGVWCGIAFDKYIELYEQNGDIIITNTTKDDFENIWHNYFDLDRDYQNVINEVSKNATIARAAALWPPSWKSRPMRSIMACGEGD